MRESPTTEAVEIIAVMNVPSIPFRVTRMLMSMEEMQKQGITKADAEKK